MNLSAASGRAQSKKQPVNEEQLNQFLEEVRAEFVRATTKFPNPVGSMCALTEEVGELAKAVMDEPSANARKEAVQVATMAARVAIQGDPSLDVIRAKRGVDNHPPVKP